MPKFRKKPVIIEAIRTQDVLGTRDVLSAKFGELPRWMQVARWNSEVVVESDCVLIKTLEGTMRAEPKDWIICGVHGEIYPCKARIFAETYEPVDEP